MGTHYIYIYCECLCVLEVAELSCKNHLIYIVYPNFFFCIKNSIKKFFLHPTQTSAI